MIEDTGSSLTRTEDTMTILTDLSSKQRREIQTIVSVLDRLEATMAIHGKMRALELVCTECRHLLPRGLSTSTLYRKYKAYKACGVRALVKNYAGPRKASDRNLGESAFAQYVKRQTEVDPRSKAEQIRRIKEAWQRGDSIPGYGTWMDLFAAQYPHLMMPASCPVGFFPAGWGDRNLQRKGASRMERKLAIFGERGFRTFAPSILRDPSKLRPMELIFIDDFELDNLCLHEGKIVRVKGFKALEASCRKTLHTVFGPCIERIETEADGSSRTVRSSLTKFDLQIFLFQMFARCGLPPYDVTIVCEEATASISVELEDSIKFIFGGRVKIQRTGMFHDKTLTNGFIEHGGRPWLKGMIESSFNIWWNMTATTLGYKGSNQRLNAPAGLDSAIKYAKLMLGPVGEKGKDGISVELPPEIVKELRLPFPSLQDLEETFRGVTELCEKRTHHKYLGFDKVTEVLVDESKGLQPLDVLADLSSEEQLGKSYVARMESTEERWNKLIAVHSVTFAAIPQKALALFALTPRKVKYRKPVVLLKVNDRGYEYGEVTENVLKDVADGQELLAYFNPGTPDTLFIAHKNGRMLGSLQLMGGSAAAIDIRKQDDIFRAAAKIAQMRKGFVDQHRARHADKIEQAASDRVHNDTVRREFLDTQKASTTPAEQLSDAVLEASETAQRRKAIAEQLQDLPDDAFPDLLS